jgi:hypothetical protein
LFPVDADNLLGQAKQPPTRLAGASLKDVEAARDTMEEARINLGPTQALCDIIAGEPLDPTIAFQPETWKRQRQPALRPEREATRARVRDVPRRMGLRHAAARGPEAFPGGKVLISPLSSAAVA